VTLTLDLRSGAKAVFLGDRVLECATVHMADYNDISAFEAVQKFCRVLSPRPLLADHVVYGSNNWYYAYGNSSQAEITEDTRLVAELCRGLENPPYMVIDDGWQPNSTNAPWDRGNERFPDMGELAKNMAALGTRPGIWVRYLIDGDRDRRFMGNFPEECYTQRNRTVLDPSHPLVLDYVKKTTQQIIDWGYTLIKHDYSCYDLFGKWGRDIPCFPAADDDTWGFYDTTKTSAEIIKGFHTVIREAAGDAVIIGCNVMGHLCAGIHHCNRTGDDTSGREWKRTLKMGVNTLAFRLPQNNAFFAADADCVGILGLIDWKYNRQWLDILARSGSPLFVSCKPTVPTAGELDDIRHAYEKGSLQADELIPLDWMETPYPAHYLLNGQEIHYDWGDTVAELVDPATGEPR
jgi:alpha-galactosidase